jgi:hypothetical protein
MTIVDGHDGHGALAPSHHAYVVSSHVIGPLLTYCVPAPLCPLSTGWAPALPSRPSTPTTPPQEGRFKACLLAEGALVFGDGQGNVVFTDGELSPSIQAKMFSGPVLLLARSRQNPPLFVAAGFDGPNANVATVKTWVGSKVAAPAHSIDVAQQLKVGVPLVLRTCHLHDTHTHTHTPVRRPTAPRHAMRRLPCSSPAWSS